MLLRVFGPRLSNPLDYCGVLQVQQTHNYFTSKWIMAISRQTILPTDITLAVCAHMYKVSKIVDDHGTIRLGK